MSLIVNTNIASINAQRSLNQTSRSLNKAMERLASGLRINRSSDDAAGLAIANDLATQVRGMNQAIRNAGDGLSLIGTADGAAGMQVEILQRVRELVVQAASDLNTATNRATIQEEIDQQVAEITRIANTTEFNGLSLMTGSFTNKLLQVGANSGQTLSISLDDFRASALGSVATTTGTTAIDTTVAINGSGNVTINGVNIANSANYIGSDDVSTVNKSGGAIAKAAAINAGFAETGVTATVLATSQTYAAVTGGAVTSGALTINGVTIYDFAVDGGITVLAGDSDGLLRDMINAQSNATGVVASLTAGALTFTAADGRNVQVTASTNFTTRSGITAGTAVYTGSIKLTSSEAFSWTATAANIVGVATAGTESIDLSTAINTIQVNTAANAADALLRIDAALAQLGESQANLGAISNRLQNTISNLEISAENMAASESRIRDADFAIETANLTRAQIIQQAGVAVLSQANLSPQAALALLGG
ncbi:flagellin [Candidatus Sumerlaeota bacterium]|nr:flagellin [Candidatus Sumerlaeota bacterium]